jgi:uncharacterized transporter YbjL
MLYYILAVIAGLVPSLFLPQGWQLKTRKHLFTFSLVALLFFMGVNLGKDPELPSKLAAYGLTSFLISVFVIVFSVVFVLIFVRLFGKKEC